MNELLDALRPIVKNQQTLDDLSNEGGKAMREKGIYDPYDAVTDAIHSLHAMGQLSSVEAERLSLSVEIAKISGNSVTVMDTVNKEVEKRNAAKESEGSDNKIDADAVDAGVPEAGKSDGPSSAEDSHAAQA